jgi:hypothetical protein
MKCVVTLSFDLGDDRAEAFRNLLATLDRLQPAPAAAIASLPPRIVLGETRAPSGAEFVRDEICTGLRALVGAGGCEWSAFVQVTDVDSAWANLSSHPAAGRPAQRWNVVLSETPVAPAPEPAERKAVASNLRWTVHEQRRSAS